MYEAQVAAAKAVCGRCPVRAECLAEALARIPEGIAGGLTPEERRRHRPRVVSTPTALGESPAAIRRRERETAAWRLLAAGWSVREVARRCGVSERTAARWAAHAHGRTTTPINSSTNTAEESHGGNRAPLLISPTHNPSQGRERRKDTDPR